MAVFLGIYTLQMIYTPDEIGSQNGKAELRVGKVNNVFLTWHGSQE